MENCLREEVDRVSPPCRKKGRYCVQYSLKALFVVTLTLALALSYHATRLRCARLQRGAVEKIRELDGVVIYDYSFGESWQLKSSGAPDSSWACRVFGEDYCHDVVWVTIGGEEFGDRDAECLKELHGLRVLLLAPCSVTDKGLEYLHSLHELEHLDLTSSQITAEGVSRLHEHLPKCRMELTLERPEGNRTLVLMPASRRRVSR